MQNIRAGKGSFVRRIEGLDGLRGLAAACVVLHHCLLAGQALLPASLFTLLAWTPLRMLATGRPPVILFFVLSGFVLTLSLQRPGTTWLGFIGQRIARIWVPFAVVVFVSAGLLVALGHAPFRISARGSTTPPGRSRCLSAP